VTLLCARLWRTDCMMRHVCDELTVWWHDRVTSWPCDKLTGSWPCQGSLPPPDPLAGFKRPTSREGEGRAARGGEEREERHTPRREILATPMPCLVYNTSRPRIQYTAGPANITSAWFIHWPMWPVRGLYGPIPSISTVYTLASVWTMHRL